MRSVWKTPLTATLLTMMRSYIVDALIVPASLSVHNTARRPVVSNHCQQHCYTNLAQTQSLPKSTFSLSSKLFVLYAAKRDGKDNFDFDQKVETLIPETSFGSETVPEEQRPVNEYLHVTRQPLFGWAALESGSQGLLTRLLLLYTVVFTTICYPISSATFTQDGFIVQRLAASNIGATFLVLVLLIRLYSGWGYVGSRLTSKVIEFEETGWYDGDVEIKSESEQRRDKYLYNDKVKPVVQRLRTFTIATGGLALASIVAFNIALQQQPLFNEYDPQILERLSYDDKLAEKAAKNSGGRPTYCDNRYYRAIANGGYCN